MSNFKKSLARLNDAIERTGLEIAPIYTEIKPGKGGPPTETGCPCCGGGDQESIGCYACLVRAIQHVETGTLGDDTIVGGVRGCNTCGDGGRSCGPHQIGGPYITDACSACPEYCAQFGGAAGVRAKIMRPCPQSPGQSVEECCRLKVIIGEHLIGCYNKKYGENPNFSCRCKNKDSSGKTCCSCEEIAKRHQGGLNGPCDDTPRRREYWRKVKERMSQNCPQCANCGTDQSPSLEVKR